MDPIAPARVARSSELGRAGRAFDLALGTAALIPLVGLAAAVRSAGPGGRAWGRGLAAAWAGGLLAFFAGVRRGLSFSEAEGAGADEIATLLGVFGGGVLTAALRSPALGAAGLATVGLFDAMAARRGEAPRYFSLFRPVQLGVGALALGWIALSTRQTEGGPPRR